MVNEYKFDKTSSWIYLHKILLITLTFTFVGFTVFKYFMNIVDYNILSKVFLGVLFGWFITFGLPLFVLYFNHKKYSKNVIFKQNGNYFIYSKGESIEFNINDIDKIELWLTPPAYDKRIDWQFFGKYHFITIHTKQQKVINISCLVFDKVKEVFSEGLIERKKKFFPLMGNGTD